MRKSILIIMGCIAIFVLLACSFYLTFSKPPVQKPENIIHKPTPTVPTTPNQQDTKIPNEMEIMAWIYPGEPACNVESEYKDGRKIDILKPEYFLISETGELTLLTEDVNGCNAYSEENLADLKKYSKQQYATVASSYAKAMNLFLTESLSDKKNIETLVSFVIENDMTGIEIDFEDFGGWDKEIYANYKNFITKLGNALHLKHKKLMIDGPATANQMQENWFVWRYEDFVTLPVDQLIIMTYDYQYDEGAGEPISPTTWIEDSIKWTLSKFPNKSKITVGIPSYGYKNEGSQKFSLLTYEQIKQEPGFDTAVRDPNSYEMTWRIGDSVYFYHDQESMVKKLEAVLKLGVGSVSVWHLGGNLWFK